MLGLYLRRDIPKQPNYIGLHDGAKTLSQIHCKGTKKISKNSLFFECLLNDVRVLFKHKKKAANFRDRSLLLLKFCCTFRFVKSALFVLANIEGKPIDGYSNDYSKIIPHYLLYTTIGRADLIEFESFYS